jgi:hypothetical protein
VGFLYCEGDWEGWDNGGFLYFGAVGQDYSERWRLNVYVRPLF